MMATDASDIVADNSFNENKRPAAHFNYHHTEADACNGFDFVQYMVITSSHFGCSFDLPC